MCEEGLVDYTAKTDGCKYIITFTHFPEILRGNLNIKYKNYLILSISHPCFDTLLYCYLPGSSKKKDFEQIIVPLHEFRAFQEIIEFVNIYYRVKYLKEGIEL